jgi:DNA-binding CsgD family transcriptional regulator
VRDDAAAFADLERALDLALTLDDDDLVARLYGVLQMTSLNHRRHARALAYAERGLRWCTERDLDVQRAALLDNRALSLVETGRWREAQQALTECLALPGCRGRLHHSVLYLQARLRLRQGDHGVAGYWRRLGAAPLDTPLGYRLPAVHSACAEAAWLLGDPAAALHHARRGAEAAVAAGDPRLLGPLLVWLARLGALQPPHALHIAPEHAHELAGDHAAAAAAWQAHGCPYEAALAGLHGGESDARRALETLMALGAEPAAEIARSRLRALGSRSVPAGPLRSTRQDPAGLTLKERQVHSLLSEGLSNAGIAARLHRSPRTVEKHVAQVLLKLGVSSRRAAAERALS